MDWKKKFDRVPGLVITALLFVVSVIFVVMMARTKMIPAAYLLVVAVVLLLFVLLTGFLVWRMRNRVRFTVGSLLGFVFIAVLAIGGAYIHKTQTAISSIAGEKKEVTKVSVFVQAEDPADSVEATKGYTYGILQSLDRDKTDGALSHLNTEFGESVATQEYAGLTELADGLLAGETGAIILNQAYMEVIAEMDGYTGIGEQVREVGTVEVERILEAEEEEPLQPIETENGGKIYTVYISGIDTRGEMTASSRSDVNIIATVNTETRQVLLVSTPRDYFVPLSISGGQPDKLTHAGIYGIDVCMDTLGMLYDEEINYYFRVNFGGFTQIIDALGGIDVYSDYEFDSKNILGWHYNQGINHMDGEAALVFARERFSFQEGDRQRGKNQMAVIKAVVDKALSPDILTKYSSVISSLDGCFSTNVTYEEIAELLQDQLKNGGSWNIVSYSVNGTGATEKPYSLSQPAYVMVPDQATVDRAILLMDRVKNGETITQEEASEDVSSTKDLGIPEDGPITPSPVPTQEGVPEGAAEQPAP
ncbi:MAG: LCP family protein [Eubacteriales bacterium]|nr:LCP family protein [Eubacteriales bacterium]